MVGAIIPGLRAECDRQEYIPAAHWRNELGGQYSEDMLLPAIQCNRAADDVWVRPKATLPKSVADQNSISPRDCIRRSESTAAPHRDTEHVQQIHCDSSSSYAFRLSAIRVVER